MNRQELKLELDEMNILPTSYYLYGGFAILKPIITKKRGKWIYNLFDEKGNLFQQYFETENDICEYVYQEFKKKSETKAGTNQQTYKNLAYKTTKKGDIIVFADGVPKWKNGIEIRSENPIFINNVPVTFNENDTFDENEMYHFF